MKYAVCALWLSLSFAAYAVETDSFQLQLVGRITDSTCEVAVTDKTKDVPMGSYQAQDFNQVDAVTPPVSFTVQLENCGTETQEVRVAFTGTGASGNNTLLALDNLSIDQLAIRILDKDKTPIALNDSTNGGRLYPLIQGASSQTLQFYAQYVVLSVPLDPGEANASAKLSLTWP
ncbi:TPA: fimbrial protein [Citrobacter braakii]|uniref:fimbrial protein n=1 Tax=Citrobacter sp. KTE151 TaxID=1169322 RepID=UPI00033001AE|nr:fimbrial protein [Citrobacter sp. KTE151]EOQ50751.1 hypothetical protein WC7_01612 [Citrobacter sp. KTE151]